MNDEEAAAAQRFLEWSAALGVRDSPSTDGFPPSCLGHTLTLSHFPNAGGRGLGAARDISKGELVLRVPKTALITSETLLGNQAHSSLSPTQKLAVALLSEVGRGNSSRWYTYFMQLPRDYNILATFSQFEIQALQIDDAIWAAEKAVAKAISEWNYIGAFMDECKLKPRYKSFKAWLWASATISSRTMHVPWDSAGCLCPVGDFFNYAAPGEEQISSKDFVIGDNQVKPDVDSSETDFQRLVDGAYEERTGAYCFYAKKDYRKGDQVLLSYGTYTNLELLEHYGFVLNDNPNDKAYIPLQPDIYSVCSWPKDYLYIHENGKPSFALLSAMRLWATPLNLRKIVGRPAYSGYPISIANEIIVLRWLSRKCQLILRSLPTSVDEDKLLLSVIDKMHDSNFAIDLENMQPSLKSEMFKFLEINGLLDEGNGSKVLLSKKAVRSLDRWKLAIGWRMKYKATLIDCTSYCLSSLNNLETE